MLNRLWGSFLILGNESFFPYGSQSVSQYPSHPEQMDQAPWNETRVLCQVLVFI